MKIDQDPYKLVRCLLMYHLLQNRQHKYLPALDWREAEREVVEEHLKIGCFVHVALIEGRSQLTNLLFSNHEFGQLRVTAPDLHAAAKPERASAQTRWSQEKKRAELDTILDKIYSSVSPHTQGLKFALEAAKANCVSLLWEAGNPDEAELVSRFEA